MIQTTKREMRGKLGSLNYYTPEPKCAFCKKLKPLPFKRICNRCIQGCTTKKCPSTGDLFKCPKTNPPLSCGSILKSGCLNCGRDKKGRFCVECAEFLKGKLSVRDALVREAS